MYVPHCQNCSRVEVSKQGEVSSLSERNIAEQWPVFTEAVLARLRVGAWEYGDASLAKPPSVLAGEVEEELLDVMGWAFLLWVQCRSMRERLTRLEGPSAEPPCRRCGGRKVVSVKQGQTFETDSADEIALAYHDEPCPYCQKAASR